MSTVSTPVVGFQSSTTFASGEHPKPAFIVAAAVSAQPVKAEPYDAVQDFIAITAGMEYGSVAHNSLRKLDNHFVEQQAILGQIRDLLAEGCDPTFIASIISRHESKWGRLPDFRIAD